MNDVLFFNLAFPTFGGIAILVILIMIGQGGGPPPSGDES